MVWIFKKYYFMCMAVLPACISLYHIHFSCSWRVEDDIGSFGTGVRGCCKLLGTESSPSARTSALNHRTISLAPIVWILSVSHTLKPWL